MKQKNIEALQSQYSRYLSAKSPKSPSLDTYIAQELVSGRAMKLRPAAEVSLIARNKIAESSYNRDRSLSCGEVFLPPADYVKAVKRFELETNVIESKRAVFMKMCETLLRKAEFAPDDDAMLFSDAIEGAAREVGLK